MASENTKQEIEKLENRNRFLTIEISQLNTGYQTNEEQKRITGNFEEIEKNKQIIEELKTKLN